MSFGQNTGMGVSPKALVKSVVTTQREFIPTESEWSARKLEQVNKSTIFVSTAGNPYTLYTVPDTNTFFVTTAFVSATNTGANDNYCEIVYTDKSGNDIFQLVGVHMTPNDFQTCALSFPMPIKVEAKGMIRIRVQANTVKAAAGVSGWLEKKGIIPE